MSGKSLQLAAAQDAEVGAAALTHCCLQMWTAATVGLLVKLGASMKVDIQVRSLDKSGSSPGDRPVAGAHLFMCRNAH
jgi:hypothetical protein